MKDKMNSENYMSQVKEEPIDDDVKNDIFDFQNQLSVDELNDLGLSSSIWSTLVGRCRFLLQEEHGHMNSYLIAEILIKETNELLSEIVKFFQDCCNPVSQMKNPSESILTVDGLLVNCLPCHPQNLKCSYKICTDIPQTYLDTLFSPLPNEIEGEDQFDDDFLPLAPNVEIDIKKETTADVKVERKSKLGQKKSRLKKEHICDICGKSFKTKERYRVHVSGVHEKKKPFKCNKCGLAYKYINGLRFHKKSGNCSGEPKNENKWIYWGTTGSTDPKCLHPDCVNIELPRFTYAGIFNHIMDVHSPDPDDTKNIQCPDCPKRFPMASVLKYHQEKAHQSKSQICNICGKVVLKMKNHILMIHSGEKRFQCDKCDYRTNGKQQLKRHMFTHSDDPMEGRRFKCEICHKAFFTNQELKQHLRIHGGIKAYKCKLCSGTFSNFSGHRQHMMKTHGLKFTCDICGKDSSSMSGLGIHKRDKHGIPI